MRCDGKLTGYLSPMGTLCGSLSAVGTGGGGDPYTGEYTVTPTEEIQTLATAGKTMRQNVTVEAIPSNYGLITWNGSTILVS